MAYIIFDYDGTLHDSMRIYAPSVRACQAKLVAEGLLKNRELSDTELKQYLGLTSKEMWELFAPELSAEQKIAGGKCIGQELRARVLAGKARLYDGALDMLKALKKEGHKIVYLSNCSVPYKEVHKEAFHLQDYFDEMYCAEEFDWISKKEIVRKLMEKWQTLDVIAVGDRGKDMQIGELEAVKTIWCEYGFGTAKEGAVADAKAASAADVLDCVHQLLS